MASAYDPQSLKEETSKNMLILEAIIDLQAVMELLVAKGIIANVELEYMRDKIKSYLKYQATYKMYQDMMDVAELYEKDPQQYLRELLTAKMKGAVR